MFARLRGRASGSDTTDPPGPKRLKLIAKRVNESLYELWRPSGTPIFHGLQSGDVSDAHLRTWESEDGSSLWPQKWLPEQFPAARVLCVAYNGSVKKSSGSSPDMYSIVENLISDFMQENIGQTPNCPVILIGHCLGGLVIKKLCLEANNRKRVGLERMRAKIGNFLENVRGVFFYGTPHHGTVTLSHATESLKKSPLISYVTISSDDASRLDFEFNQLLRVHATWLVWALGEADRGVQQGQVGAPEWTSRKGDEFNLLPVDHASICKPKDKADKRFYFLTELLHNIARNSQVVHEVVGLPRHPCDLERRALVVEEKLIGSGSLGICGMGGIGKTTLARQAFNLISKDFEYTCFVNNVKDIQPHELENWVLNQFRLNGKKLARDSTDWSDLQKKKILIAMDDVNKEDQLRVLPNLEQLGTGCCIIMTSRNREVFKYYDTCIVHEVDRLSDDDAKRLFCQHAFGCQDVPDSINDDVDAVLTKVVGKCDGLPLTLEVLGQYLREHRTNVDVWNETLERLEKAQPITGDENDRVWAPLRISYDALAREEREKFTEAALFFFGRRLDDALAAWSTPTQTMQTVWNNLVSRSLVKEVDNRVWVHEHLRALALQISKDVMVSGTHDTAKSAVDLLIAKQVETTTKCLKLDYVPLRQLREPLRLPSLGKLKGLKYVDLNGVALEGSGTFVSTNISFLSFHRARMGFTLNKMQNLAVLELSHFQIPDEFPDALENMTNLRILRLSQLKGLAHLTANLGRLHYLRKLEIDGASELQTLPDSFSSLPSLRKLTLKNCSILERLPHQFGELSTLEKLVIRSSSLAGLPESFGRLHHLRKLEIDAGELRTLPDNFSGLKSLQKLTLECLQLERFPNQFGELSNLEELVMSSQILAGLPESFGRLHHLRELEIDAGELRTLPDNFSGLKSLQKLTLKCLQLERLPDQFGELSNLEKLVMSSQSLAGLPESFGRLHHLRELDIVADKLRTLPDNFSGLKSLQKLTYQCWQLERLPDQFGELSSLEELFIISRSVAGLPESFGRLHHLRKLMIGGGELRTGLPESFGRLHHLRDLEIHVSELRTLPDNFSGLESLQKLTLWCLQLERLPDQFCNLRALEDMIIEASSLAGLPESFGRLHHLRELYIDAGQLRSLPDNFSCLKSLQKLTLRCSQLERLPDQFGNLCALEDMIIEASSLAGLPESFGRLHHLRELVIDADELRTLPDNFSGLESLQTLTLRCSQLEKLPDLCARKELSIRTSTSQSLRESLRIACLQSLPESLGQLSSQETLEIGDCHWLESLPENLGQSLGQLSSLEMLEIGDCHWLESLPKSLGQLSSLNEVRLSRCDRLKTLPESLGQWSGSEGDDGEELRRVQAGASSVTKKECNASTSF